MKDFYKIVGVGVLALQSIVNGCSKQDVQDTRNQKYFNLIEAVQSEESQIIGRSLNGYVIKFGNCQIVTAYDLDGDGIIDEAFFEVRADKKSDFTYEHLVYPYVKTNLVWKETQYTRTMTEFERERLTAIYKSKGADIEQFSVVKDFSDK